MLSKTVSCIDWITDVSGRLCSWAVLLLNGVVVYEVIARYFFNNPSMCNFEVTKYIFGFYFMMLGAYALLKDEHVSIDIFQRKFSKKTKKVVDIICFACLFFPFSLAMFWNGIRFARVAWEQKERTWSVCASPL